MRYQVSRPSVVREAFDDEVVIVDLDSGNYYSLDRIGAEIWQGIENGSPLESIIAEMERRYDGEAEEIARGVTALIGVLAGESLIAAAEAAATAPAGAPWTGSTRRLPFSAPTLSKYSDMQELLLLDPVHDVDETGWPARPRDEARSE